MRFAKAIAPFEKALRFLLSIPSQILATCGLATLLGTLILSTIVQDKNYAVAIAISGTFVGTVLVSVFLPKAVAVAKGHELRREFAAAKQKRDLEESESQRDQATLRAQEAEREIDRLEAMRIKVDAVRPILNLGLLEVETSVTDFRRQLIGREGPEAWWRSGYRDAYVGVVRIPIRAHLGVDLQQVRIGEEGDALTVRGLVMTTVTDTAQGATWLLDEVRTEYVKEGEVVKVKGDMHDERTRVCSREHELQVRDRLQHGQEFKVFEAGLIRTAEQLLRVLLEPLGKDLRFETTTPERPEQGQPLLTYLANHNQAIARRVAQLKSGGLASL